MTLLIKSVLFLGVIVLTQYNFIMAGTIAPSDSAIRNLFAANLYSVIVDGKEGENIVYSPATIHNGLTLAFLGADGQTAEELRNVLKLGNGNKMDIAERHGEFWRNTFKGNQAKENAPQMRMATRLYLNDQAKLSNKFNEIAKDNFQYDVVSLDFRNSKAVAEHINNWAKEQTENKIKNIIQADSVNADTNAIIVNVMYFKAKWQKQFDKTSTAMADFHVNSKQINQVETMHTDDRFNYVDIPELDCIALELPYQDSDVSMLIIMPNQIDGLGDLASNLNDVDLNDITSKMTSTSMKLYLPKFHVETEINLHGPLQKLGLTSMFSQSANFNELFDSSQPQGMSEFRHKSFVDVNEAGTEAAAAEYFKIMPMSLNLEQITVRIDRSFLYAIRSKTVEYMRGHVSQP